MRTKEYEEYIERLQNELPEPCRVSDLLKYKIFNSITSAFDARANGKSPPYIQLSKKGRIIYPRNGVIEWMKTKINAKHQDKQ